MAIAFVKDFYSEDSNPTVPAAGFASGNLLVLATVWDDPTNTITGITDTGSNAWSQVVHEPEAGANFTLDMWYSKLTTALVSGNTITISMTGNSGAHIFGEWSGIASAPFDQATSAVQTSAQAHTSGTVTTTQADEVLVGAHATHHTTAITADSPWIQNETQTPFGLYRTTMQYRIVSATGTYESTASTGATFEYVENGIATFKAAGVENALAWTVA